MGELPAVALATPVALLTGIGLTTVDSRCVSRIGFVSGTAVVVVIMVRPTARRKLGECIVAAFCGYLDLTAHDG